MIEQVYHTAEEVGRMVGVSGKQIRRWARAGILPHYKPGKVYLFKRGEVIEAIERYRIQHWMKRKAV